MVQHFGVFRFTTARPIIYPYTYNIVLPYQFNLGTSVVDVDIQLHPPPQKKKRTTNVFISFIMAKLKILILPTNTCSSICSPDESGGGRVVRWCWVNFQCRGVLLIWNIVGQGPIALVVGAGGGCLDIFSLIYHFSFLSPSLWETARYRLKYCLKGPLGPKQPTNQPTR